MNKHYTTQNIFHKVTARVKCVEFHPSEPWILLALYSGTVSVWNYVTKSEVKSVEASDAPIRCAQFIPRQNWVITGGDDMTIRVFDLESCELVHKFVAHEDYIRSIDVHPFLPFIVTSSDDTTVKLWNWENQWKLTKSFEGHIHYVMMVKFNPNDPDMIATASLDCTIKLWNIHTGETSCSLDDHARGVNCINFDVGDDGKTLLASGSDDHTVKIWDYHTGECLQTLTGPTYNVSDVLFHPTLPVIISAGEDETVLAWNMNTCEVVAELKHGMGRVWTLASVPEIGALAFGCDNGVLVSEFRESHGSTSVATVNVSNL